MLSRMPSLFRGKLISLLFMTNEMWTFRRDSHYGNLISAQVCLLQTGLHHQRNDRCNILCPRGVMSIRMRNIPSECLEYEQLITVLQISCHGRENKSLDVKVTDSMMTSSNGNIFRFIGPLCPAQMTVTRSFDVFFHLRLNKRLSKQSWGWRFENYCDPVKYLYQIRFVPCTAFNSVVIVIIYYYLCNLFPTKSSCLYIKRR